MSAAKQAMAALTANLAEAPDDAVVEAVRAGNVRAYEVLMRRYNRRLFRVTRSILGNDDDAQDAMQEAYVRAYRHLGAYVPQGTFPAWLTRIAVNEALMKKRRNRPWTALEANGHDPGETQPSPRMGPDGVAANDELRRLIEAAIDRLPESFRAVFVLRAMEELSVQETADCLDVPAATVKTRFHRARALMQKELYRHIQAAGLTAFDFAGARCDRMVAAVLARLTSL